MAEDKHRLLSLQMVKPFASLPRSPLPPLPRSPLPPLPPFPFAPLLPLPPLLLCFLCPLYFLCPPPLSSFTHYPRLAPTQIETFGGDEAHGKRVKAMRGLLADATEMEATWIFRIILGEHDLKLGCDGFPHRLERGGGYFRSFLCRLL